MSKLVSNLISTYYNLTDRERNALFYPSGTIKTPFTKIKITYADYIASGQPCALIENYMIKYVYPYCGNTHSNAFNGIHMKNLISHVKDQIRANLNVGSEYKVLFPGNGTTGTANTGGGGGGSAGDDTTGTGGNGGKGVVILRMPTANYSNTTTGSPTVTTSGADTILVFNDSGSYTG